MAGVTSGEATAAAAQTAIDANVDSGTVVLLAFSRMLGESRGERRFTRSVCVALAGADRLRGGRGRRPLLPRPDDPRLGYSAHTLRHLAARLAFVAAGSAAGDGWRPPARAYLDSLLDHASCADPLGYLDTSSERAREQLSRDAIHAIWDLIRGDARPGELDADHARVLGQLRRARRDVLTAAARRRDPATVTTALLTAAYLSAVLDDYDAARPPTSNGQDP